MPVRFRSRSSIAAIICRPCLVIACSSSSSALYPVRITPGSFATAGGSSDIPRAMVSHTSRISSSWSRREFSLPLSGFEGALTWSLGFGASAINLRSTGTFSSDCRSASKSRGLATPNVTRLVSRSRSKIPSSVLRISSRTMVWERSSATASNRALISCNEISGRTIQPRSSRAPMPVAVSSMARRSVADASSPAAGSTSSRFRVVTASSTIPFCCS